MNRPASGELFEVRLHQAVPAVVGDAPGSRGDDVRAVQVLVERAARGRPPAAAAARRRPGRRRPRVALRRLEPADQVGRRRSARLRAAAIRGVGAQPRTTGSDPSRRRGRGDHPVAILAVVLAAGDPDGAVRHPGARDLDRLPDRAARERVVGADRIGQRDRRRLRQVARLGVAAGLPRRRTATAPASRPRPAAPRGAGGCPSSAARAAQAPRTRPGYGGTRPPLGRGGRPRRRRPRPLRRLTSADPDVMILG